MFVPWTEGEDRHYLGKGQLSDFTDIYQTSESQQSSGEKSFGNYCKHTNSVPHTDDTEQIFLFMLLKLQNQLRAEPLFPLVHTWWTSRTNLARAKRGSCTSLQTTDFISREYWFYIRRKVFWFHLTPNQYIGYIYFSPVPQEKVWLTAIQFCPLAGQVGRITCRKPQNGWCTQIVTFPFYASGSSLVAGHWSLQPWLSCPLFKTSPM